ncbi:hypothetical protein EKL30_08240 [Candidimonas sp. SYP-B2681]|uniref:hypothetical protein n=1 Tax=Candidimonas sp. SYP-B2681 TaxID=2497686 RepID=UPI000F89618B|nr:hypothetical protein [Candidimonas sp. SYP-B2681]RTZ44554.1 hypothetical protein EKL30_08240 [Candidimonas sp. SYP-B2681]
MKTARVAFPYDYSRMEAVISEFLGPWRTMDFDAVVSIARGGLVPGVMASTSLGVPLYAVAYSRSDRAVSWFTVARPSRPSRLLVIEDVAGRGTTLSDCAAFLLELGHDLTIFALAYDSESRITPQYGLKIPQGFRAWFPWERESITAAFDGTLNGPDRPEYTYASWAIDLDGVLLMDLPEDQYQLALHDTLAQRDLLPPNEILPRLDLTDMTIITGRPEQDRQRTQAWLSKHGFHGPLIMRDEARHTSQETAAHKAQAILDRCHTHYIESDPTQALNIAYRTKVAKVYWWDGRKALMVYANEVEQNFS